MPLFNVLRVSLFVAVLAFSLIVLGVSAYLESVLEASDLTRFISIAIFVAVFTILVIGAILIAGTREKSNIITQTRVELLLVSVAAGFWVGLSAYLAMQPLADVDCPEEDDPAAFTTEIFHAQYHVLEAFSILNLLLLVGYALFFFFVAWRHHRAGRRQVWNARVNQAQWFTPSPAKGVPADLPPPVTTRTRSAPLRADTRPPLPRNRTTGIGMATAQTKDGQASYVVFVPPVPPKPPSPPVRTRSAPAPVPPARVAPTSTTPLTRLPPPLTRKRSAAPPAPVKRLPQQPRR